MVQYNTFGGSEFLSLCRFFEKQSAVHKALCDSLNTPIALQEIMDLVSRTNVYISATTGKTALENGVRFNPDLLRRVGIYVSKMMKVTSPASLLPI
jgi:cysteinyl-tRNA synthetase